MRLYALLGWLSLLGPVGCGIGLGPTAKQALGSHQGTQVGGSLRGLVELPRSFRAVVGGDVTVDRELSHDATGLRGRLALLGGYSALPDRFRSHVGWEVLGRGGYLWARIGHPLVDSAVFYGGEFGLPIRLGRTLEPWNADGLVYADFYLVPSLGVSHLIGISNPSHYLELAGGLALRVHLDSSLLP